MTPSSSSDNFFSNKVLLRMTAFGLTKFCVRMTPFGLTKFCVRMTPFGLTKFYVRMKLFRLSRTTFGLRPDAFSFESDT